MNTYKIGLSQRLLKRHVFDPSLLSHQSAREAQFVNLLDRLYVRFVLISRVVAQQIHVEANTLLDKCQPDPSCPDHRDGLASYLISQKRQVRMPESPAVFPRQMFCLPHLSRQLAHHEKRKLCG